MPVWWLVKIFTEYKTIVTTTNHIYVSVERSRRYPAQTITDVDYADDIALLINTPAQAETLLHSLERAAGGIGPHVNANKTEYIGFNQIHLPRKQRLINREWHQYATSKGMDSYQ